MCAGVASINLIFPDMPDSSGISCPILVRKCPAVARVLLLVLDLRSHLTLNVVLESSVVEEGIGNHGQKENLRGELCNIVPVYMCPCPFNFSL